ncbi:MAG TPA: hypothetical protein VLJ38_09805 [Polyangiaceae bacterium]|nr:hypothetical protein [Polyangiaceae bacterium]
MSVGDPPSGRQVALALAVLAFAPACHRKAPGPEECREFAYQALGVRSEADLQVPGALKRVDDFTTECLLTPFDRELLACVAQGLATRLCLRDFDLRHPTNAPVLPSRAERRPREFPFP